MEDIFLFFLRDAIFVTQIKSIFYSLAPEQSSPKRNLVSNIVIIMILSYEKTSGFGTLLTAFINLPHEDGRLGPKLRRAMAQINYAMIPQTNSASFYSKTTRLMNVESL